MEEKKDKDSFWQGLAGCSEFAGHPLELREETGSTNSDALTLGRQGAVPGTVVIARSQRGGRGRLGKKWLSPPGSGLYFSLILRPGLAMDEVAKITLAAGLALCRAVAAACPVHPMLKWPNDLLIGGRKCGGILTEMELDGRERPLVVIGIGVNVSTTAADFGKELVDRASSLEEQSGARVDRGALFAQMLSELDRQVVRLEEEGFAAILADWRRYDATLGKRLTWLTGDYQVVTGVSLGPDREGRLNIRDDEGRMHEVLSGDIRLQSL